MARKSIGEAHLRVTADGKQFATELNRTENVARRSAANIDREIDKLTKNIRRKFSLSGVGRDILGGIGLGSGMAIAQRASEFIASGYERAAQAAKEIEAASERQLRAVEATLRARRDDKQELQWLLDEQAKLQRELDKINSKTASEIIAGASDEYGVPTTKRVTIAGELSSDEAKRASEIDARLKELINKINAQQKKVDDLEKTAEDKKWSEYLREQAELLEVIQRQHDQVGKELAEENRLALQANEHARQRAENYRLLGDPMREYRQQLEEISHLEADFWLSGFEAAQARAALMEKYDMGPDIKALKEVDGIVLDIDEGARETAQAVQFLGMSFSSAFEDAIVDGGRLSDVMHGLLQDIARIGIRLGITNPIVNTIFGKVKGWESLPTLFGGAFAGGGRPPMGKVSLVGEEGPELFVPDVAGRVIPAAATAAALGGGRSSGGTYYIDARGADRAGIEELKILIHKINGSIEPRSVAAVLGAKRRGGGLGGALAFA